MNQHAKRCQYLSEKLAKVVRLAIRGGRRLFRPAVASIGHALRYILRFEFLERCTRRSDFFDESGEWRL